MKSSESLEFHFVYFHAQITGAVQFVYARYNINLKEKSVHTDSRMMPFLNALHVGFLPFTLRFNHLVNSFKKVN